MSEKRKPDFVMLLQKYGKKKTKIELFHKRQFSKGGSLMGMERYRLRVNGKWWEPDKNVRYYTLTKIKEIVFRNIIRVI